ncbi:uncharacterized protein PAC_16643 [Phialocephala subalpina]|uniref:Uncharacterized protein n=1 Tax=Phialocephala subalpina TaxID=576137 RepID=A0A1L7XNZ4_9HELO|nr:uncharacterized protein PAC_16643 [Phialocephala subalpina]
MNAVMRDPSTYLSVLGTVSMTFDRKDYISGDILKRCWDQSNFVFDDTDAVFMDVKWENKKMLKFLIDFYAYKATQKDFKEDDDLKVLLTGRDQLALQIARAIGAMEKVEKAPWHEDCVGEYLVNEDMTESRFESDCRWEGDPQNVA